MRLQWESAQQAHVLLYPEGMVRLNGSAGAIVSCCDGVRTLADIVAELERTYGQSGLAADVRSFVTLALEKCWLESAPASRAIPVGQGPAARNAAAGGLPADSGAATVGPPLWLLLELTYRCPLHCVFCYNPTDFAHAGPELATQDYFRVLGEARALGAVQLGLSGGEPLVREDLELIVAEAHRLGFYINLITSGVGLNESRLRALKSAGLDHIQLSFQDSSRQMNDFLSSTRTFDLKSQVAALIKSHGFPMVLNVVLHRLNIDHVEEILEMAERCGAEYVELANTQFYGWAWKNREQLLPSRRQLVRAEAVVERFRARLRRPMRIFFVVPDYFERRPKACMNGLGSIFFAIAPDGTALPCHAAGMLPGLKFPNVKGESLAQIWYESAAFNHFRGDAWMREPCRSCPERFRDFGGCRCQAYLLTGDAANADPVCEFSPHHHLVAQMIERAERTPEEKERLVFRSASWPKRRRGAGGGRGPAEFLDEVSRSSPGFGSPPKF